MLEKSIGNFHCFIDDSDEPFVAACLDHRELLMYRVGGPAQRKPALHLGFAAKPLLEKARADLLKRRLRSEALFIQLLETFWREPKIDPALGGHEKTAFQGLTLEGPLNHTG